ncbi:hypothetical protein JZ751_007223 [Albula glossodonta]|uniref:Zinc transporter ZIP1 n=1 Tax=Albula glossodonta TaxID=121402 RepID=A0A8T2NA69_9TELE|nr:hypothetical protein JZ751_007223 [Albula glossodonta]
MDASSDTMSGLAVKLASLAGLMSATLFCGLAPLCAVKRLGTGSAYSATQGRALNLAFCFADGVFLATCLLDQVPNYLKGMHKAFDNLGIKLQFPLPEFILSMGFFLPLLLERTVLTYKDQLERLALLVELSVQSQGEDKHGHAPVTQDVEEEPGCKGRACEEAASPSTDPGWCSTVRSFVLTLSLSLHAALQGLTAGLQRDGRLGLWLCAALLARRCITAPCLALKLGQGRLRRSAVAGSVLLFSLMSPLGGAVGVALTRASTSSSDLQQRLAKFTVEGVASGTFIYATMGEILQHEAGYAQSRISRLGLLLTGFAVMTGLVFINI